MEKIEKEAGIERLPVTKFEYIDLDREAELADSFMGKQRWLANFIKKFPELETIQQENQERETRLREYRNFLAGIHDRDSLLMASAREAIQIEWEKIGATFLDALSKHFETEWPEGKEIIARISVLPVHPRHLDTYSFSLGYKDLQSMVEVAAHEILHFLWFKKWKEVFPEIERKEYESPHLAWRLSEIMDPIILQCHTPIAELVHPKKWGYESFKSIIIDGVTMTEYFKKVYVESITARDPFGVTLQKLWKEAQLHEQEINSF